jgi:hypothetical protein
MKPSLTALTFLVTLLVAPPGRAEETSHPQAIIAGEVETPTRFDIEKGSTLGAVFDHIAKPLPMGSTRMVLVSRNGKTRILELTNSRDFAVNAEDIVEICTKSIVDEGFDQDEPLPCQNPAAALQKIASLEDKRWKTLKNWRSGRAGIEFRSLEGNGKDGGIWVFVNEASEETLKYVVAQHSESPWPKGSRGVLVTTSYLASHPNPFGQLVIDRIRHTIGPAAP